MCVCGGSKCAHRNSKNAAQDTTYARGRMRAVCKQTYEAHQKGYQFRVGARAHTPTYTTTINVDWRLGRNHSDAQVGNACRGNEPTHPRPIPSRMRTPPPPATCTHAHTAPLCELIGTTSLTGWGTGTRHAEVRIHGAIWPPDRLPSGVRAAAHLPKQVV